MDDLYLSEATTFYIKIEKSSLAEFNTNGKTFNPASIAFRATISPC